MIYEVNLNINEDIYADFMFWLKDHVNEMLQFPGFMQASFFKEELDGASGIEKLTVQYQLDSKDNLDRYLTEYAPAMREDGIKRFNDKFSATRRIFEVQDIITK